MGFKKLEKTGVVVEKNEQQECKKKDNYKYAIFGISNCFWNKSLYELLYAYQKKRKVPLSYYFTLVKCGVSHILGTLDAKDGFESYLNYCKGMTEKEVKENSFMVWKENCKDFIFKKAKNNFEECKKNKVITILAEAGMRELYNDFLSYYSFDYVCTSEIEFKDGKVTGKLLGDPCSGNGKYNKVKDIIEKKLNGSLKDAVFYANSHNDIPLLEAVGKPIAVNPTSKLESHAKKKGWQILKFKEVEKTF